MGATRRVMMGLVALVFATGVAAQEMRIQFAEKAAIAAAPGRTEFDAYGRRFSLSLESNSRLLAAMPAAQKGDIPVSQLLRGKVEGMPGSWVRLARVNGGLEGAIWDGKELYVVTRHANIAGHLTLPLDAGPSQTVLYRLSDTVGALPEQFCGLAPVEARSTVAPSALKQYAGMVAELRVQALTAPTDQLEVSLISDAEFQTQFGSSARDTMLARLNTVDGIFSEQVGVLLAPTTVRLVTGSTPFNTSDGEQLLRKLSDYRRNDVELRGSGITHLMTGKNLNGNLAGIAFLDALCEPGEGVSLGDSEYGEFSAALVMAHELGHNFGAQHDSESGSVCASTPDSYLMAPYVNFSSQFSACSLSTMRTVINRARTNRCIGDAIYSDASVSLPASEIIVDTLADFTLPVTVRSAGTVIANNVRLRVDLPVQLNYQSATMTNGTCTHASGVVECEFGNLEAGQERVVNVVLRSGSQGTFFTQARVTSEEDRYAANNTASAQIGLQSAVDLAVALSASATTVYQTDTLDLVIDISSIRSQSAQGATLNFYHNGLELLSLEAGPNSCTSVTSWQVQCQLADLPAQSTTRITVRGRATSVGSFYASATVFLQGDGRDSNNAAWATINVLAERELKLQASSGYLNVVVGSDFEITYTVTASGRLPTEQVDLLVSSIWNGTVESVSPSAGTCGPSDTWTYICNFGTLAPGETRTVVARMRITGVGSNAATVWLRYFDNSNQFATSVTTWIYANLRTDASAQVYAYSPIDEGQTGFGGFNVRSVGIDPIRDVVATLEVTEPARLTHLYAYSGSGAPWQCTQLTPQRARCIGSFESSTPGESRSFEYRFTSDTAMSGVATLTVTATGDGDPANDSVESPFEVRLFRDVAVATASNNVLMNVGETATLDLTLTTGRNPVEGVVLSVNNPYVMFDIESVRVNGVECPLVNNPIPGVPPGCQIGDVPANVNLPITITYRALQVEGSANASISVSATHDSNMNNNWTQINYVVQRLTDISLSVAQTSATAQVSTQLRFPLITITPGEAFARNVEVTIPLPPSASVQFMSASNGGICSGTTTLRCSISAIQAGFPATLDLAITSPTAGSFTSNIEITASNDMTSTNNSAAVALTFTAPPPPPPPPPPPTGGSSSSSGGGKKGGGSLEWLALAFLGLLVGRLVSDWRFVT